jgi:hypothetical protein
VPSAPPPREKDRHTVAAIEVMTLDVKYCFEDEDLDHVARSLGGATPLMNREKRRVGILSLGDVALGEGPRPAGDALAGVSRAGGAHSWDTAPHPKPSRAILYNSVTGIS